MDLLVSISIAGPEENAHEDVPAVPVPVPDESTSELRLVTVNVDGVNHYIEAPATRIELILDNVLKTDPHVIAFQEVLGSMFKVLRARLSTWKWYCRRGLDFEHGYFNVTAVSPFLLSSDAKTTAYAFPSSRQERHILHSRLSGWGIVNIHAESGGHEVSTAARWDQMLYLSRVHERDSSLCYITLGDFNVRDGEDS